MQSLSTYARQFLEKFQAPDLDSLQNIPPTIALEQVNPVRGSRATVGTSTEIYDYFRLLFEKIGIEYCPECETPMEKLSFQEMTARVLEKLPEKTPLLIGFKIELPHKKALRQEVLEGWVRTGFTRCLVGEELISLDPIPSLTQKEIIILVDRVQVKKDVATETRVSEDLRNAIRLGAGLVQVYYQEEEKIKFLSDFSSETRCLKCGKRSTPKTAASFSFNSPLGACETCKGFGNTLEVDPELIIPNPKLSIAQGAIDPFIKPSLKQWQKKLLAFCKSEKIDPDLPFRDLKAEQKKNIFEGKGNFIGVRGVFDLLAAEKYKMRIRVFISRYNSAFLCKACMGNRLKPAVLQVKIGNKNLSQMCGMNIMACQSFFKKLKLTPREKKIATDVLSQVERRLENLSTVGLGYLTLSRLTKTLSGGEYQRILLSTQLSQGLTDTLYVLDEPSIGLHPKDTHLLLQVLERLQKLGNSLLIVEHDPEIMQWADYLIDMGPGSGIYGGTVVFSGDKKTFLSSNTQTAKVLSEWKTKCKDAPQREINPEQEQWLELTGASENNLNQVDIKIPLKALVSITGVSGSGKSTLIVDTLYQALNKIFKGTSEKIGKFQSMSGFEYLSGIELVDQSPIGKSSRSNPITFMKGYDEIRSLFSETPLAVQNRYLPGHFSFNVTGGRCDKCEGEGRVRIDMVFMEDVFIPCEECQGKRFKPGILKVKYKGKNIDDCLKMTVEEAYDFFSHVSTLRSKFGILKEVGLGYLQLGQPGFTLSGGEAQRLKIARELASGIQNKSPMLYILDEPTTGLHFNEVEKLISVLRALVSNGHTVIVIEHNLQMICSSHYVIDLGPDGGDKGGNVVAVGSPKEIAKKKSSHTGSYLAEVYQ
jgi:excinuclease ABC subunit A